MLKWLQEPRSVDAVISLRKCESELCCPFIESLGYKTFKSSQLTSTLLILVSQIDSYKELSLYIERATNNGIKEIWVITGTVNNPILFNRFKKILYRNNDK